MEHPAWREDVSLVGKGWFPLPGEFLLKLTVGVMFCTIFAGWFWSQEQLQPTWVGIGWHHWDQVGWHMALCPLWCHHKISQIRIGKGKGTKIRKIYVLSWHFTSFHPGILVFVFLLLFACQHFEVLVQHPLWWQAFGEWWTGGWMVRVHQVPGSRPPSSRLTPLERIGGWMPSPDGW